MMVHVRSPRPLLALPLIAAAMIATPASAQDAAVAPPPIVPTVPAQPAPAAPQATTAINPEAAAAAEVEQAEQRPARTASRRTAAPTRSAVVRARTPATAPVAAAAPATPAPAAPMPRNAPADSESTPAPTAGADAPVPNATASEAPEAPAPAPASTQESGSVWPWLLGALVLAGLAAAFFLRRPRPEAEMWEEPAYIEDPAHAEPPVYAAPIASGSEHEAAAMVPVAAAPTMMDRRAIPEAETVIAAPDDVSIHDADADDVATLTAAAPVTDRPWLELAMRPLRAGITADDALIDIELTVGNAGSVDAHEVRVSTFMLTDADTGEIERMLVDPPVGPAVEALDIVAGGGARIDATLSVPRTDLRHASDFRPVIVAEARYRLPDGTQGRTAAAFDIGVAGDADAAMPPFSTTELGMREDIEARLNRVAERA